MATNTLATVYATLADRYGLGRRGTNTGVVATSLTDDSALGGRGSTDGIEPGCQVLIDAGTRAGDITQLSTRPALSTGLASVDPNFGGVLSATSTYIILRRPLRFIGTYGLRDAVNKALQLFSWEKRIVPITLVTDGDMLASGTTSWSEVGSGALSKVAATFPLGQRVLRMTGVAANDYILSATIAVEPETNYYLEVLGMISSTGAAADTGTLVLYDETNAASITLNSDQITIDTFEPEVLVNSVTTPSGCKQVTVRLEADNAGDIIDWGHVILRKNDSREFVLADRPQKALWVGRLLRPLTSAWGTRGDWREVRAETPEQRDNGIWVIKTRESVSGLSLWYEEIVKLATLTAVTDTTPVPLDDLCAVAAEELLKPLRMYSDYFANAYAMAADDAAGVIEAYQQQNAVVVNSAPAVYPTVRV